MTSEMILTNLVRLGTNYVTLNLDPRALLLNEGEKSSGEH